MQKHSRAERRHHRARVIARAFRIYWRWQKEDTYACRYFGYERVYLESEEARWAHQDSHRAETLDSATRLADHMAHCRCVHCSWQWHPPTPRERREHYRDLDDLEELSHLNEEG